MMFFRRPSPGKNLNRQPRRIQIKHLTSIFIFLLAAVVLNGCSKEEPKKDFVARVNNSYLTSGELSAMLGSGSYSNSFKNEFIHNWVKREVLYQAALNEGLLNSDEYKRLLQNSRKELAAALMLNKYFEEESIIYEPKDVEEYFQKNKDNFKLFNNAYLVNVISFRDEDKAIRFRLTSIETDWKKALNVFKNDSSIIKEQSGKLLYEKDIHPAVLLRMVRELNPEEISIVLSAEPDNFIVAQLVQRFEQGTIPPFETIKEQVEKTFIAEKKENKLNDYLHELYSNNEIEIKSK